MAIITYVALCILIKMYNRDARADLDLEQSGVLYVCQGGPMTAKCSTNANLLRWNVTLLHNDSVLDQRTFIRTLSLMGTAMAASPISTALTTLNISRSLNESSPLPLISMISTDNTSTDLNGTVITCSAVGTLINARLVIFLFGNNIGSINITHISEQFRPADIVVTMVSTLKIGVSYSVSVDPEVEVINYSGKSSAQLILSYNTNYNISVVASLCEKSSTAFTVINYVTCDRLASEPDKFVSHRTPALVETVAAISCHPGLVLTGPNVTICMANGYWEPDPESAVCKVDCHTPVVNSNVSLNYSYTLEGSLLIFQCEDGLLPDHEFTARCYRNGTWIPNPSYHVCATSSAVICGDPSPPSNGYLETYTSTIEGARVNVAHVCQDGQLAIEESVCSSDGQWEVINGSACTFVSSKITSSGMNNLIIAGVSLGCLFGVIMLVLLGIIITTAVVITKRKAVSSRSSGGKLSEHHAFKEKKKTDMTLRLV